MHKIERPQLIATGKSDRLTIRRPKWSGGAAGPRKEVGIGGVQRTNPDTETGIDNRDEGNRPAVGRHCQTSSESARLNKPTPRRRLDLKTNSLLVFRQVSYTPQLPQAEGAEQQPYGRDPAETVLVHGSRSGRRLGFCQRFFDLDARIGDIVQPPLAVPLQTLAQQAPDGPGCLGRQDGPVRIALEHLG